MLRRLFTTTSLALLLLVVAACGSGSDPVAEDGDTAAPLATTAPIETPDAPAPTPTNAQTVQPTAAPTMAPVPTSTPATSDSDGATVKSPAACGPDESPLLASYRLSSGVCPSTDQQEELAFIWAQNREFWTDFPAQLERFVTSNTSEATTTRQDLAGLSTDQATALITTDVALPMSLDSGPTQLGTMTLYEFSGGSKSLLVIARDGVVGRVYTFDLG